MNKNNDEFWNKYRDMLDSDNSTAEQTRLYPYSIENKTKGKIGFTDKTDRFFHHIKDAYKKLKINDQTVFTAPETSSRRRKL